MLSLKFTTPTASPEAIGRWPAIEATCSYMQFYPIGSDAILSNIHAYIGHASTVSIHA